MDGLISALREAGLTQILASVAWIVVLIGVRWLSLRALRKSELPAEMRRRWLVSTRTLSVIVLGLGWVVIWATELLTFAVSVVAVAAALVLATKKLIMGISGAVLQTTGNTYKLGDRIEIQGYRGDVIDQSLLTTTLLEIGPGKLSHQYTGSTVVLPNSLFLNSTVINETFSNEYVPHTIVLPLNLQQDWRNAETYLLQRATDECAPSLETARHELTKIARERGLEPPSVEPRISYHFPEPNRVNLILRLPVPARRKGRIEQAILRRFLREGPIGPTPPPAPPST